MKTSAIEGEMLDRQSVQSSLRRQLGLSPDSYPWTKIHDISNRSRKT